MQRLSVLLSSIFQLHIISFSLSFPTVCVPEFCPRSQYLTLAQHPLDGWNRKLFRTVGFEPTHTVQQPRKTKISNKILFLL